MSGFVCDEQDNPADFFLDVVQGVMATEDSEKGNAIVFTTLVNLVVYLLPGRQTDRQDKN